MNRWAETDMSRETWSFLVVDADDEEKTKSCASAWALGDGNADHFLGSNQYEIADVDDEEELLSKLCEEIDSRRYQEITLITPTQETLSFLRARLLATDAIPQPTLRGFRHVALREVLSEYVDTSAIEAHEPDLAEEEFNCQTGEDGVNGESVIKSLWELRVEFGPLVPADALYGTKL